MEALWVGWATGHFNTEKVTALLCEKTRVCDVVVQAVLRDRTCATAVAVHMPCNVDLLQVTRTSPIYLTLRHTDNETALGRSILLSALLAWMTATKVLEMCRASPSYLKNATQAWEIKGKGIVVALPSVTESRNLAMLCQVVLGPGVRALVSVWSGI